MQKKTLEILIALALIVTISGVAGIQTLGYTDSDGDGIPDNEDAFPNDPLKSKDSDGDGVEDRIDAFPYDPDEQYDRDRDGVGNNADAFPFNPRECTDSDGDGVGDNQDLCPNDPNEQNDSDGDGIGDNQDECPYDPSGIYDLDKDGYCDENDVFPEDPNEWMDSDEDGVGDNEDECPEDPNEQVDTDGDGVGDNSDSCPNDPCKWRKDTELPTGIELEKIIEISEIVNAVGIAYDGSDYYIINYDVNNNDTRKVYIINSDFSYSGVSWDYSDYIVSPTGITYCNNLIYITGNELEFYGQLWGFQTFLYKFTKTGTFVSEEDISSDVGFASTITSSNNNMYIGDSKPPREIHIYDLPSVIYEEYRDISISHFPTDIIFQENDNWLLINDQSPGVQRLYLYCLDGYDKIWDVDFRHQCMELVGDRLIAITGSNIFSYKLS